MISDSWQQFSLVALTDAAAGCCWKQAEIAQRFMTLLSPHLDYSWFFGAMAFALRLRHIDEEDRRVEHQLQYDWMRRAFHKTNMRLAQTSEHHWARSELYNTNFSTSSGFSRTWSRNVTLLDQRDYCGSGMLSERYLHGGIIHRWEGDRPTGIKMMGLSAKITL